MDLTDYTIHELHDLRLKKQISTLEIVLAYISRIEKYDSQLNCYLATDFDQALATARLIDSQIANHNKVNPLAGMPIAIKDIFNQKNTLTTCGSKILENYIAPYDATVVTKLNQVPVSILGKTNMDEFAMGSSTEHSAFKITKNPWNIDYVPGGSSGGSAAAVAANLAVAALGTDTGGSIRLPASYCGVVGLKPTYGLVSRYGMTAYASSLDQGGPIAKDVTDAALLLDAIAGYDAFDSTSLKLDYQPIANDLTESIKGIKIGIIEDIDISQCSLEVQKNYQETINLLTKAGVVFVPINIKNINHVISTYYIIATAEASSNLGRFDGIRYGLRKKNNSLIEQYKDTRNAGFGDEVKLRILLGTYVLSAGYYDAYYNKAKKVQLFLRQQIKQAFKTVQSIILPVAPTTAFKIGAKVADPIQMYLMDFFTVLANIVGIPALAVPTSIGVNNLPLGVQFLADHLQEKRLVQIGYTLEQIRPTMPSLNYH